MTQPDPSPDTAAPDLPGIRDAVLLDIETAILRIEQIGQEGSDTCGGLILDRLITCDAPRLRGTLQTVASLCDALEAAEAQIERVRELHQLDKKPAILTVIERCKCGRQWPCPTIAALGSIETREGEG
jgi:hypothetical protein